jgi:hypothetical protein
VIRERGRHLLQRGGALGVADLLGGEQDRLHGENRLAGPHISVGQRQAQFRMLLHLRRELFEQLDDRRAMRGMRGKPGEGCEHLREFPLLAPGADEQPKQAGTVGTLLQGRVHPVRRERSGPRGIRLHGVIDLRQRLLRLPRFEEQIDEAETEREVVIIAGQDRFEAGADLPGLLGVLLDQVPVGLGCLPVIPRALERQGDVIGGMEGSLGQLRRRGVLPDGLPLGEMPPVIHPQRLGTDSVQGIQGAGVIFLPNVVLRDGIVEGPHFAPLHPHFLDELLDRIDVLRTEAEDLLEAFSRVGLAARCEEAAGKLEEERLAVGVARQPRFQGLDRLVSAPFVERGAGLVEGPGLGALGEGLEEGNVRKLHGPRGSSCSPASA